MDRMEESWIGKRVVVGCLNNLSYAGRVVALEDGRGRSGFFLETDARSGFAVWCPESFIRVVREIPVSDPDPALEGYARGEGVFGPMAGNRGNGASQGNGESQGNGKTRGNDASQGQVEA